MGRHDVPVTRSAPKPVPSPVPPAVRAATPGWRDPRLWIGVAIVAVSVLVGARLLDAADDTVQVWGLASDMGPGDEVAADDLVAHRVRFAAETDLDRYFTVDDQLPGDLELTRAVTQGELLPRSAVGAVTGSDTLQVPIAVDAGQVPASVGSGSVVDIYLVPSFASPSTRGVDDPVPGRPADGTRGGPALAEVTVVDAPRLDETFSTSGKRQLVLAVDEQDARRFFELLGSSDSPVITVVRRG